MKASGSRADRRQELVRERGGRRGPAPVARGAAVGGNGSGGQWGNQHLHLRALFFSSFRLAHLTEQVSRRHPRCNVHRSFLFPGWVVFRSRVHRSLAPVRRPVDGWLCLPAVVGSAAGHVGAQRPASLFPVPGACPGMDSPGCGVAGRLHGRSSFHVPTSRARELVSPCPLNTWHFPFF